MMVLEITEPPIRAAFFYMSPTIALQAKTSYLASESLQTLNKTILHNDTEKNEGSSEILFHTRHAKKDVMGKNRRFYCAK